MSSIIHTQDKIAGQRDRDTDTDSQTERQPEKTDG